MRRVDDGIPMELQMEVSQLNGKRAVLVGLYRTDRKNPHSLCLQFHLTQEDIQEGRMSFVVYDALREEMGKVLWQTNRKVCDQLLGRTKRKNRSVSD